MRFQLLYIVRSSCTQCTVLQNKNRELNPNPISIRVIGCRSVARVLNIKKEAGLHVPDLNRTMAFMHANSAGLTLNLLYLAYICDRWLMRAIDSDDTTS